MKKISIVTACYNEEGNIEKVYSEVKKIFDELKNYEYEHIFIDNRSKDRTVEILKEIAIKDRNVKVILNSRNFGHIRSPFYGRLQGTGDAIISIVADLQDPPELIKEFLLKWEEGFKIVVGVKKQSKESKAMFGVRKLYYKIVNKLADVELIDNFTGFGLYDRQVINILKDMNEPIPYFRGLICEVGFEKAIIEYTQPKRHSGKSKNNFLSLFDMAMTGIISHSKVPLRLASYSGFIFAGLSFFIGAIYLIYKIMFWDSFTLGIAPIVIGFFFFSSIQLIFIGIIGEYIGMIYSKVSNRPLVVEEERINFELEEIKYNNLR